jgi:hypothetical protein
MAQPFVKVFAAPGIDSDPRETGVFNSGAAFDPNAQTLKTPPYDWLNEAPEQGYETGQLVGNGSNGATKGKPANSISVRRRGISPWGGFFHGGRNALAMQHPGGIVDTNTGASSLIAGGPGQASTFARVHGGRSNRGMKLPVLPQETKRGGQIAFPAGGGSHEPLVSPLQPNVPGFVSIFMFRRQPKAAARA